MVEDSKSIFFDFDGCVCPDHFPDALTTPPHKGLGVLLDELKEAGYELVLYSCRANPDIFPDNTEEERSAIVSEMLTYCAAHNLVFDRVAKSKPLYLYMIDDRALQLEAVDGRQNWWKIRRKLSNLLHFEIHA